MMNRSLTARAPGGAIAPRQGGAEGGDAPAAGPGGLLRRAGAWLQAAPADALVLTAIAALAGGLELALALLTPDALTNELFGTKLTVRQALHNGDLFTLLTLLAVALRRLWLWASPAASASRLWRSASLFGIAWLCGAIFVSGLHVALAPGKRGPASRMAKRASVTFTRPWAARQRDGAVWIRLTPQIDLIFKQKEGTMIYANEINDRDSYINECWKKFARTWADVCVQARLMDVIGRAKKGDSFDWPMAQEQFGKSLLVAIVDGLTSDISLDPSEDVREKIKLRYLEKESTYLTAIGTLHQFGWFGVKHALLRSEAMIDMPDAVLPDVDRAVDYYEQAAAEHDPTAQILLGFAYLTGAGVPQSYAHARAYFEAAQRAVPAAAILRELAEDKRETEVSSPH